MKEVEYLINKFLFNFMTKIKFYDLYFSFFFFVEKSRGDVIFEESEELKYVYFVQEGEIEYSLSSSIIGISKIITLISKKLNILNSLSKSDELQMNKSNDECNLNSIKKFKIFSSTSEHIVGLEEYFYKIPKFFKGKVISKSLKYYAISIDNLLIIFQNNVNLNVLLENSTHHKLNTLLEKLKDIKKSNLEKLCINLKQNPIDQKKLNKKDELPLRKDNSLSNFKISNLNSKKEIYQSKLILERTKNKYLDQLNKKDNKILALKTESQQPLIKNNSKNKLFKKFEFPVNNDLKFNNLLNINSNSKLVVSISGLKNKNKRENKISTKINIQEIIDNFRKNTNKHNSYLNLRPKSSKKI